MKDTREPADILSSNTRFPPAHNGLSAQLGTAAGDTEGMQICPVPSTSAQNLQGIRACKGSRQSNKGRCSTVAGAHHKRG